MNKSMIGVVVAANGYPDSYEKGAVSARTRCCEQGCYMFSMQARKTVLIGEFETNGGRVLLAGAKANYSRRSTKGQSIKHSEKLQCDGVFYRKDIGFRAIAAQKS